MEQLDIFSLTQPIRQSNPDAFGCCSRYRVCSDVGKCVNTNVNFSSHCAYRRNLEAGRFFYGKNADNFSLPRYKELCDRIAVLSEESRIKLNFLIIDLCEYHRGAPYTLVRTPFPQELRDLGLFGIRPLGAAFPLLCSFSALKAVVSDDLTHGPMFQQAKKVRGEELTPLRNAVNVAKDSKNQKEFEKLNQELKSLLKIKPGENTRDFLIHWLNEEAASFRDMLAAPYCFAYKVPDESCYIEEFYQDNLIQSYDSRIYPVSPLDEDGLRTLNEWEDDEERRVQLSHGYPPDERARRIAEIQQARSARSKKRQNMQSEDLV